MIQPPTGKRSTLSISILLWAVFTLVVILIPALLFRNLLMELVVSLKSARENRQEERAGEMLARLDQAIDPIGIIRRGLVAFTRRSERFLKGRQIDNSFAQQITRDFQKKFPHTTLLRWYGSDGRFITVGEPPQQGVRSWQFLFDVLTDRPGISPIANSMADNMIHSLMGDLISVDLLKRVHREPIKILFNGRPYLLALVRFHGSEKPVPLLGSMLAFIPLDRARPGWELDHAVRQLQRSTRGIDVQFGGVWQSTQIGTGTDRLDPAFLNGLWQRLASGTTRFVDDRHLFLFRLWQKDPDLMIVTGIERPHSWATLAENTTESILRGLPFLVCWLALIALSRSFGLLYFASDLRSKFLLGTALLAGMPLAALVITGFSHLSALSETQIMEAERHLESILDEFEQAAAEEKAKVEREQRDFLQTLSNASVYTSSDVASMTKFCREQKERFGLESMIFVRKDALPVLFGISKSLVHSNVELYLVNSRLHKYGFSFRHPYSRQIISPDMKIFLDQFANQEITMMGHMQKTSFGTDAFLMYQALALNKEQKAVAYLFSRFGFSAFQKKQIQTARKKLLDTGLVRPDSFSVRMFDFHRSRQFESPHPLPFLKPALNLVEVVGKRMRITKSINGEDYVILARPIKTLDNAVAAIAFPVSMFGGAYILTVYVLMLLSILAIAGAFLAYALLPRFLLQPLLEVGKALTMVDQGDYTVSAPVLSPDEIGVLAGSFNLMLEGLRQKERMSIFLRDDLVKEVSQINPQTATVSHQRVVISFSGLRRFSDLERSLPAEEAMAIMNEFISLCVRCVQEHGGEVDKFIGDTVMSVFRGVDNGAAASCAAAAFALQHAFGEWMDGRRNRGLPTVRFGVGIAVGDVLAGRIGSFRKRLDFTIIGDAVNLAARLEKLAGSGERPPILAISEVCETLGANIRRIPTKISEVRGRRGEITVFGLSESEDNV
ncbi:MAG: HAMP domain-containing protein [Candidatus Riflebacteria bacterium]|nr:HAMP domain-containing protein [Candidatus Riflebacteria bacterium]